jgi:transcriptional regulator with XRE-family HTH domain
MTTRAAIEAAAALVDVLAAKRRAWRISQETCAAAVGVHPCSLSNLETWYCTPRARTVLLLADALGFEPRLRWVGKLPRPDGHEHNLATVIDELRQLGFELELSDVAEPKLPSSRSKRGWRKRS